MHVFYILSLRTHLPRLLNSASYSVFDVESVMASVQTSTCCLQYHKIDHLYMYVHARVQYNGGGWTRINLQTHAHGVRQLKTNTTICETKKPPLRLCARTTRRKELKITGTGQLRSIIACRMAYAMCSCILVGCAHEYNKS